ncbi:MAG TPA: MobF family relaxase [Acidimicrobiales bacterium]|jgi:conjugative relaxase-like TrwC/TraI family protein|nr:MobF family relaxase [Acidimicrobiales bacterium]
MATGIRRIGAGRADYYLSDLATELPLPGWHGSSRWVGRAAGGLGLDGAAAVDDAAFRSLLRGQHPRTGRPLASAVRVAGFDLTFSAPKSASVLFALGGEDVAHAVMAAHHEAVDGAVRYLESHALGAVRRAAGGAREVVATSGFAGARFTHGVSRNLDPHLHSHVVVVNAVHGADGRWSACDGRGLDAHRRAASDLYDAHLRWALTASLGVRWDGRTAQIVGVPPAVLGEFSSRGADVRRHAFETASGHHVAWAATRPAKVTGTSYAELAADWSRRAAAAGPPLEVAIDRARTSPSTSFDEHHYAGVISLTPHGGAHRRDVVGAFAVSAPDGAPAAALERVTDLWAPPAERVGVAEDLLTRRSVVPAGEHLRALGPRPVDPADHRTWLGATRAIDAYRERWGIGRAPEPLGAEPLSSLPATRLADHLRVARQLDAARVSLGRRAPAEMELGLGR